jgi:carboxymethylenebutenolidase
LGGGLAIFLATLRPEVAACVPFYGGGPAVERADFTKSRAAFLGHWGELDHSNPRERVEALEKKIRDAGLEVEMHFYPDCDHAFFNDQRPEVYNPEAAQLAWDRTLAFLRSKLANG